MHEVFTFFCGAPCFAPSAPLRGQGLTRKQSGAGRPCVRGKFFAGFHASPRRRFSKPALRNPACKRREKTLKKTTAFLPWTGEPLSAAKNGFPNDFPMVSGFRRGDGHPLSKVKRSSVYPGKNVVFSEADLRTLSESSGRVRRGLPESSRRVLRGRWENSGRVLREVCASSARTFAELPQCCATTVPRAPNGIQKHHGISCYCDSIGGRGDAFLTCFDDFPPGVPKFAPFPRPISRFDYFFCCFPGRYLWG
jgi:hypothetical protein